MDRRTRKRQATRQIISDAATCLFMQHGFDQVTVDQIAEAADVSRKTVFNHFSRKEDMFFDREDEIRNLLAGAVSGLGEGVSPITALRLLAHRCVKDRHPLLPLYGEALQFVETALASEALKARARQLCSEFTRVLAGMLAGDLGQPLDDPDAHLVAGLLVATWTVAFAESYGIVVRQSDADAADRTFLRLIDQGSHAAAAALAATPYARGST